MTPIPISLSDYVLSGGGANGESYDHRTDPSVMLKLYFPGKIQQPLDEMLLARKVYDAGIPTPEPGDYVVTEDGRYGIRFRRILGKKSYARATGDNPENVERYATEFASMCKALHSVHLGGQGFETVPQRYLRLLEENPFFTLQEKDRIAAFIESVPEEDTAVHGDLQFGNAIFTPESRYFIDLGDFCTGNHLYDVAMVYLTTCLNEEAFTLESFHMTNYIAREFWRFFAPAYFGTDRPLASIEEEIGPFAGLKTLIVERDTKRPMPEFRVKLQPILK